MSVIALICPACSAPLRVDAKCLGRKGRCPSCGKVFVLTESMTRPDGSATDDDVLGWLGKSVRPARQQQEPTPAKLTPKQGAAASGDRGEDESDAPASDETFAEDADPGQQTQVGEQAPAGGVAADDSRFNIRLDHVDSMGAFFLFDSRLLRDDAFRAAFPQSCILCGGKDDLSVYPVVWSCKLQGKVDKNDLLRQGPYVRRLDELTHRKGRKMLSQLKRVENIPEPYNLPFPYYVCPSCSPVGAIMTHVHTRKDPAQQGATQEICELGISSLTQAERFARVVCGADTEAVREIHQARMECMSDAWRTLPLAVRNRIKQWFEKGQDEKFIAYVSDADFAKAEAGTAGLVITDQRLVYRKSLAELEIDRSEPVEMDQESKGSRTVLVIHGPEDKDARLVLDAGCVEKVRRLIEEPKAQLIG